MNPRQRVLRALAWSAILCYGSAFAAPASHVLSTDMNIWDVDARDLNLDGKQDIIAVCCDEKRYPLAKQLAVFLCDAAGSYPDKPTFVCGVDEKVGTLFFAEVDGAPPAELIMCDARTASVFGYKDAAFVQISASECASLLPTGAREPTFFEKCANDLDADGIDEWLIPVPSGYSIRHHDREIRFVPCDVNSQLRDSGNVTVVHRLPQVHVFDVNGQKNKALAFVSGEFADFVSGEDWSQFTRFAIPRRLEDNWDSQPQMADIDNNGYPDLLVTQTQGTVNVKVVTQVYMATGAFTYPDEPTASFTVQGSFAMPLLTDINSDKRADLVFIKVPYGLKLFANYFLRGKLSVVTEAHLYSDTGFSEKPDYVGFLSLDAPDGRQKVAYAVGDFTGGGRVDLAVGAGKEKLLIYDGGSDRFLSSKPLHTVTVPTFGDAKTFKLNSDSKDDLVLFHPATQQARRIEIIVF